MHTRTVQRAVRCCGDTMAAAGNSGLFLVICQDLSVHAMERPLYSPAMTAREVLRLLKCSRDRSPVMHRCGRLTLVWRDPTDVSFDVVNPAAWHVAGQVARGLVVVTGPEAELRRFRLADVTSVHTPPPERFSLRGAPV